MARMATRITIKQNKKLPKRETFGKFLVVSNSYALRGGRSCRIEPPSGLSPISADSKISISI